MCCHGQHIHTHVNFANICAQLNFFAKLLLFCYKDFFYKKRVENPVTLSLQNTYVNVLNYLKNFIFLKWYLRSVACCFARQQEKPHSINKTQIILLKKDLILNCMFFLQKNVTVFQLFKRVRGGELPSVVQTTRISGKIDFLIDIARTDKNLKFPNQIFIRVVVLMEMWWLLGSVPDFWGRGPGFESVISLNDIEALQDHCEAKNIIQKKIE